MGQDRPQRPASASHDDCITSVIYLKVELWDEVLASLVLLFQSRGLPAMPRPPRSILDYKPIGILADEHAFYDMCEVLTSQSAAAATSSPSNSSPAGNTVPVTTVGPIHGLLSLWDDMMHELTRWHQFPRLPFRSVAVCALTRTDNVAHLTGWSSLFPQPKPSCDMELPDNPPRLTRGPAAARKATGNNITSSCRSRVTPPAFVTGRVSPPCSASSGWTTIQRGSRASDYPLTSLATLVTTGMQPRHSSLYRRSRDFVYTVAPRRRTRRCASKRMAPAVRIRSHPPPDILNVYDTLVHYPPAACKVTPRRACRLGEPRTHFACACLVTPRVYPACTILLLLSYLPHRPVVPWTTGLCCRCGIICITADVYGSKPLPSRHTTRLIFD